MIATALSELPEDEAYKMRPAVWRQLRGASELRLYEVQGGLSGLISGVGDLRAALDDLDHDDRDSRDYVIGELAVALTRLGEQTSDLAPLHEALALLDARLPFYLSDYRMANARAVAMMRVGAMAGDSTLVELAARDLQAFVRSFSPAGVAAEMCDRNIVAILLENARQERSERVYSDVIRILDPRVPPVLTSLSDRHFAQFLGSALLEVAKIELESDPTCLTSARRAVSLLERLVDATQATKRSRLEALHQLGQARFLVGFATRARDLVEGALTALREALALCELDTNLPDGRRPRLFSDLANYTLAAGRLFSLPDAKGEAERLFEFALAELPVERAPGLRVQMAHGLLDLLYREARWERAVEIAEDIDAALALVEGDPRLSAGVRLQGGRLRATVTSRHVTSLCAVGRVLEAAVVLERGRGRRIAIAVGVEAASDPNMSGEIALEIAAAEDALRQALSGDDDTACRLAWERLAQVRRKAGFDLGSRADARASLRIAAPTGGAFVQLHFSERASYAFVWLRGAETPLLVDLPAQAFAGIGALFGGRSGWIATYDRALGVKADGTSPRDRVAAWNGAIQQCQQVLGDLIFATLGEKLTVAGVADGARIYICPPGDLALLPIATARLGRDAFAADRWSISIVPNARILTGKPRSIGPMLCVGGWTDGSDGHPALPMATLETRALSVRAEGIQSLALTEATPARLVAAMASASVVHLACHAVYDVETPRRSGLELPGSRLTLSRLASSAFEQIPARLVYLSCCEAGMTGRTRDFDEFVGMPGGFLQLGVQGVIASLWAVDDVAAMVFALAFYERWSAAASIAPAAALASTQYWMRTAGWDEIQRAGYLPREVIDRMRLGQFRSKLRRVEDDLPVDELGGDPSGDLPFREPMHWAGWTLFGS